MSELATKTIISLGCGLISEGETCWHVDIRRTPIVDQVVDLDVYPWPFPSNHFARVIANDILEHLDDAIKAMEEIYRVLVPYGYVDVRMPNHAHSQAYRALDHKRFANSETMDLFVPGTSYFAGYSYYTHARFDKVDFHPYGAELCWTLQKRAMDNGSWEAPNGRYA